MRKEGARSRRGVQRGQQRRLQGGRWRCRRLQRRQHEVLMLCIARHMGLAIQRLWVRVEAQEALQAGQRMWTWMGCEW